MSDIRKVIKLLLIEKKDIFYSILFGFLAGISAVGLFANSGYLISKAAITPPLYILTISIGALKLFSFTRALSRYAERFYSHRATFTILSNLRVSFFEKLEPLAPKILLKYRSGDLLSRIVGDVESLQNFFLRVYYPPIVMVIVFLTTIAFTAFFSIYIAIVLVVGLIITGFIAPIGFALKQIKLENKLRQKRGELSVEATEFLYGFRDLKLYQKLEEQKQQLIAHSNAYINEQNREGIQALYNNSVNQIISFTVSWLILGIGAYFVATGQLDGVFLAMLVMISLTVFENSTPMAIFPTHFEDTRRAAKRLFSVVEEEAEDKVTELNKQQLDDSEALSIEMKNVSFTFPYQSRQALRNVSLKLRAGSKTAIVGPSGSGKSTLLQLLLKVYVDYQGEILLGGTSLRELAEEDIWKSTNTVLQNNHFFYGTIKDNLLLAKDNLSDAEMLDVLMKVKLETFSLSDPVLEKGDNLSGGEKQRLAIARAILKGSRIWLLDEPTSSVDLLTEKLIYNDLFEQAKENTLILVSHRLTGLEKMDQIIVMEQGTTIESGTFEELMEQKGYFYEMKQIEKEVLM